MISFIIPVFNAPQFVGGILLNLDYLPGDNEIIVIDNASDSPTQETLERLQSKVDFTLHTCEKNIGFGPANNLGAELATGNILVFTQSDVTIQPQLVGEINRAIDTSHEKLMGPRLLDWDTGWNTFGDVIIPYLEGWFLMCSAEAWAIKPHFDPIYWPADFEDIDLSHSWGKDSIREVKLSVRHLNPGQSWKSLKSTTDRHRHTKRMRTLFEEKWYPQ